MKNFILFVLSSFTSLFLFAQTGPGGVGSSTNIEAWLDASRLGLSNNVAVSSWTDFSGNSNDAEQFTSANQPVFFTNQVNSQPSISFDGVDDFFRFSSHITSNAITFFAVYQSSESRAGTILSTENHYIYHQNQYIRTRYINPVSQVDVLSPRNSSYIVIEASTNSDSLSGIVNLKSASLSSTGSRTQLRGNLNSNIGFLNTITNRYFNGNLSEVIVFNENLSSARKNIISNYLGAKYNLITPLNLYAFKTSYNNDVFGIGQEDATSHTIARGLGVLELSNPSNLNDGDYLLVGHDDGGFGVSTDVPGGIVERWEQVWRADKTGTPGNIDLEFFLGTNDFAANADYVLLIENVDGDFANGGTSIDPATPVYNAANNSISFNNVDLIDGIYFTLAESSGEIDAISNGNWNTASTWSCSCTPALGDVVNIVSPFTVTVDALSSAGDLTIENGASLSFSGNHTLELDGNLSISSSTTFSSGTVSAVGSGLAQIFTNSSGSTVSLVNLSSSNPNGLDIIDGDWSLSGSLEVSAGVMDVSSATSFTLTSTASSTSQILPSVADAFDGDFTIQRFISARNANYANLASPVESATIADWDDDLYMSGVNGVDGNATYGPGGPIYYSVYSYDFRIDKHDTITSTATALSPGKGYEVWLADNNTSYNGGTIDVVGVPTTGNSINARIDQGWNLLGNPYHSFIEYDSIKTSTWVPDNYYIFNTDNGSYDFFNGAGKPAIAPSQGFWIRKIPGGNKPVDFRESGKVNSSSSSFLRKKSIPKFMLSIHSDENSFTHQTAFNFDVNSTNKIDEKDAYYLKSPEKRAPAIYSKAINSEEGLIFNSLSPFKSSQLIPIEVYAGIDGIYSIDAENINELYKDYSCVYLKDKANNEAIDLSVEPSYQFETSQGTSNRFELIVSNSFIECEKLIEDGSFEQKLDHQLALRNAYGQWYVDYTLDDKQQQVEIRVLNMAGQEVKEVISFGASNAGTYPLQNLQDLNGIYLIQVKTKDGFLNKTVKL